MQMSQVGKDKAVEKDGAALQAAIKGAEEQKQHDEAKEAIQRGDDSEKAAQPVNDRSGRAPEYERKPTGEADEEREGAEKTPDDEEIVKDPDLGAHIDLTG